MPLTCLVRSTVRLCLRTVRLTVLRQPERFLGVHVTLTTSGPVRPSTRSTLNRVRPLSSRSQPANVVAVRLNGPVGPPGPPAPPVGGGAGAIWIARVVLERLPAASVAEIVTV